METDLKAAFVEFGKEVQKYPQNWTAEVVYGSMQGRNGDTDGALLSLRQALKSAPPKYRWLCHAELGRANLTAGNLDASISEFETAERLMGANAQIHFFLSQAYRRAGRKADAQRETAEFEKLKAQEDPLGVPGLKAYTFGADK
jgi:Flp pilus assembly protein TadD